jgi:hypothetical protein
MWNITLIKMRQDYKIGTCGRREVNEGDNGKWCG